MSPFILKFSTPLEDKPADVVLGILTKTSVAKESVSDPDRRLSASCVLPNSSIQAGYGTRTRISGEEADSSIENCNRTFPRINMGTLTATNVNAEATDRDPHSRSAKALPCY